MLFLLDVPPPYIEFKPGPLEILHADFFPPKNDCYLRTTLGDLVKRIWCMEPRADLNPPWVRLFDSRVVCFLIEVLTCNTLLLTVRTL